jgi:hypothetical protein
MVRPTHRRLLASLAVLAFTGATCILTASPASAIQNCEGYDGDDDSKTDYECWTDDGDMYSASGTGFFESHGERLKACDNEADGQGVVIQLRWWVNGELQQARAYDRSTSTGDPWCVEWNRRNIAEGKLVHLRVCNKARPELPPNDCSAGDRWQYATA